MMRLFSSIFYSLATAAVVALFVAAFYLFSPGPSSTDKIIQIEEGANAITIANALHKEGVISHPLAMRIWARVKGGGNRLKAGEYEFPAGITLAKAYDILLKGESITYTITIPEGLTVKQIVNRLNSNQILQGEVETLPIEGSLLPETYQFGRGESRQDLINRMKLAHDKVLDDLWSKRQADLPFDTKEEAVVLASIVEKETGIAAERPKVAGLFINRLHKGMLLQADPTVVYAVTDRLGHMQGRRLLTKHLQIDSPFNTYKYRGLPPEPIANPGRASLEATLNPEKHGYIFFVADGTGGHIFAETLSEHNRNVAEWRKIRRARGN